MAQKNREQHGKRKGKRIWLIAVLLVTVPLIALVLYNNKELILSATGTHKKNVSQKNVQDRNHESGTLQIDTGSPAILHAEQTTGKGGAAYRTVEQAALVDKKVPVGKVVSVNKAEKESVPVPLKAEPAKKSEGYCDSLLLQGIDCSVIDRQDIVIRIALQLYTRECGRELLLKRDDLKVLVKKTVQSQQFGDIQIESLRNQLKKTMNEVLDKSKINDIVFRDFRIEEVSRR